MAELTAKQLRIQNEMQPMLKTAPWILRITERKECTGAVLEVCERRPTESGKTKLFEYYNNVQYAELSDYFYVWQKRTFRDLYPDVFGRRLTNKTDEAVANPVRDGGAKEADQVYEQRMSEIFAECRRVMKDDGVMTMMFTHKTTAAWETLTKALIENGWIISSSFPVDSEFAAALNQKDLAAAASSIFIGEFTGLTKDDVYLNKAQISVNHTLIYRVIDGKAGFHITTPKTESGNRIIPILYPEVIEQLSQQIEAMDALYPNDKLVLSGYHGFIFRNRYGSFLSVHNINRAIERISTAYNMEELNQAELEDREPELLPHFSVHNLRHTFCTRLCESTNDIKFIQQVMGHADFSTTMDIYTHITQESMEEKAATIKGNLVLM